MYNFCIQRGTGYRKIVWLNILIIVLIVVAIGLVLYSSQITSKYKKIQLEREQAKIDEAEKEKLLRKEAMIVAKESLNNEREKQNDIFGRR